VNLRRPSQKSPLTNLVVYMRATSFRVVDLLSLKVNRALSLVRSECLLVVLVRFIPLQQHLHRISRQPPVVAHLLSLFVQPTLDSHAFKQTLLSSPESRYVLAVHVSPPCRADLGSRQDCTPNHSPQDQSMLVTVRTVSSNSLPSPQRMYSSY
jgi:hypothetical protein